MQFSGSQLTTAGETPAKVLKLPRPKEPKKSTHVNNMTLGPIVMLQDCMEFAPTQKKFLSSIEDILENAQQMDLMDLNLGEYN